MDATRGWLLGLTGILAIDAVIVASGEESLSECYARLLRRPATALPVAAVTVYLVAHLAGLGRAAPRFNRYDPLHRSANLIRSRPISVRRVEYRL